MTPDGATARIRDDSDGTLHSLSVGDVFDKWHVDSIAPDRLAISNDRDKRVYDLFARPDPKDKTGIPSNEARSSATASATKSNERDCAGAENDCDGEKRHQQDLVDFFGSKAK